MGCRTNDRCCRREPPRLLKAQLGENNGETIRYFPHVAPAALQSAPFLPRFLQEKWGFLCAPQWPLWLNLFLDCMNLLLLGRGKTGSLVAEVAAASKHHARIIGAKDNIGCAALTPENLARFDTVIDFTAPHCVLSHIEACVKAGKNMVAGTTGWYKDMDHVRKPVEQHRTGFIFGS